MKTLIIMFLIGRGGEGCSLDFCIGVKILLTPLVPTPLVPYQGILTYSCNSHVCWIFPSSNTYIYRFCDLLATPISALGEVVVVKL